MSWENRAKKVEKRRNLMKKHGKSMLDAKDTSFNKVRKRERKRGRFIEHKEWL